MLHLDTSRTTVTVRKMRLAMLPIDRAARHKRFPVSPPQQNWRKSCLTQKRNSVGNFATKPSFQNQNMLFLWKHFSKSIVVSCTVAAWSREVLMHAEREDLSTDLT